MNLKTLIILIGIIIGFILLGIVPYAKEKKFCQTAPVNEINIKEHKNLALHIHAKLKIVINEKEQLIPANIGISPGIMRPIHTHDSSGELHIEGPCVREYRLGEFFEIWEKTFNSQCIFEYCTENGTLTMEVNGKENNKFENYLIKDKDEILIKYLSKEQNGK